MCLNSQDLLLNSNIIFFSTLGILIIYMFLLFAKKKNKKKHLGSFIKLITILFLVNIIGYGIFKYCPKGANSMTSSTSSKTTTKTSTTENVKPVNKTTKGYTIEQIDGATYVDNYLIANKTYALPSNWVPTNPHTKLSENYCASCIDETAYSNWLLLKNDAAALNLNLWIQSGYRSYSYQEKLYNSYVSRSGKTAADTYSARAGHSEHQTGLAFDLNSISDAFANTEEGKWVNENCYLYGFIIRYPKNKNSETGYKYESWHLRYVGKDLAKNLYNNGDWITMESYFGIESKYS